MSTNEVSEILKDVKEGLVAKPGDMLVLSFGRRLHDDEAHDMIERLKEWLPGVKVVLLDGVDKIALISRVHNEGCCDGVINRAV
jgi:hypothetical protein